MPLPNNIRTLMEMSDIFLTLVGLIIAMLGWFMSRLADRVNLLLGRSNRRIKPYANPINKTL